MNIDHRIAQLLVSRVCHDLAGGVSAVSTGTELLGDAPDMVDEDALSVIALSAKQSAARLAFFRVAFGLGGGESDTITTDELKELVNNYIQGGRLALAWAGENRRINLMVGKLLLNLCLIASESLPRGGVVNAEVADVGEKLGFAVSAQGEGAKLRPGIVEAADIGCGPEILNARTVHAHFMQVLATSLGAETEIQAEEGQEIRLAALI